MWKFAPGGIVGGIIATGVLFVFALQESSQESNDEGQQYLVQPESTPAPIAPAETAADQEPLALNDDASANTSEQLPPTPINSTVENTAPDAVSPDPGFDAIVAKASFHRRQFVSEPRDREWASTMELDIESIYATKPELYEHGIPRVSCRTTICEIFLASDSSTATDITLMEWIHILGFNKNALRIPNIQVPNIQSGELEDDSIGVVMYLTKTSSDE